MRQRRIGFFAILLFLTICITSALIMTPVQTQAASKKKISLNYKKLALDKKASKKLKLKNCTKKVTWKSSKPKVASVSKKGVVKAKSYGKAKITAKSGNKKYTCTVIVEKPCISQSAITLKERSSQKLSMKKTIRNPQWSTDNKKIAVVTQNGTVTGVHAGTTMIHAKIGKKTYSCKVTVTDDYYRHTVDEKAEDITTDPYILGVFNYVNIIRSTYNLPPLTLDRNLTNAAKVRASECAVKYDHTRPDGSDFYSILDEGPYKMKYEWPYENIARGQTDAKSVVDSWMKSKDHKEAILTNDTTITGIGYFEYCGKIYWCQIFVALN